LKTCPHIRGEITFFFCLFLSGSGFGFERGASPDIPFGGGMGTEASKLPIIIIFSIFLGGLSYKEVILYNS
jgi:hypothetical protein